MKKLHKLFVLFVFFNFNTISNCQEVSDNAIFITLSPVYSSRLIDMEFIAYEELYFVVADDSTNIDSVLFILSKNEYTSRESILDSLDNYFRVYNVIDRNKQNKRDKKISAKLKDYNNYNRAHLLSLKDDVKIFGAVHYYIMHTYGPLDNIYYQIMNSTLSYHSFDRNVVITKM